MILANADAATWIQLRWSGQSQPAASASGMLSLPTIESKLFPEVWGMGGLSVSRPNSMLENSKSPCIPKKAEPKVMRS